MIESSNGTELTRLLERARSGNAEAQGQLLELYRNYLRFLARAQIGSTLRVRLDSSDLVQETLLDAHRGFEKFCGTSEAELVAWLRRILVRNLADQLRHDRRQKRDRQRQESLEAMLERSSLSVHEALARGDQQPKCPGGSPGASCPPGRCDLSVARGRPGGDRLAACGAAQVREDRTTDGPLGRRGADAVGEGAGEAS